MMRCTRAKWLRPLLALTVAGGLGVWSGGCGDDDNGPAPDAGTAGSGGDGGTGGVGGVGGADAPDAAVPDAAVPDPDAAVPDAGPVDLPDASYAYTCVVTVEEVEGHTHEVDITQGDFARGETGNFMLMPNIGHVHVLRITEDQFAAIVPGEQSVFTSGEGEAMEVVHTHEVYVVCEEN